MFETDCKTLAEALISQIVSTNEFGYLVSCCRSLVANNPNSVVSFIRRQANKVAYSIVRVSFSHTSFIIMNEMH